MPEVPHDELAPFENRLEATRTWRELKCSPAPPNPDAENREIQQVADDVLRPGGGSDPTLQSYAITNVTVTFGDQAPPPFAIPDFTHVVFGKQDMVALPGVLANDTPNISTDTLSVSAVSVNGTPTSVSQGSSATVTGEYGSLQIFSDGHYTYTASGGSALPSSGVSEDIFGYTAQESDGASASSTLTVVVTAPGLTYVAPVGGSAAQPSDGHYAVLDGAAGNAISMRLTESALRSWEATATR
jgi:VCBS repeat-containing protein